MRPPRLELVSCILSNLGEIHLGVVVRHPGRFSRERRSASSRSIAAESALSSSVVQSTNCALSSSSFTARNRWYADLPSAVSRTTAARPSFGSPRRSM